MSATTPDADAPTELDARTRRALTEPMQVVPGHLHPDVPDHQVAVYSGEERYAVDLTAGTCTCEDCLHRGVECKHQRRVALRTGDLDVPAWVQWDAVDRPLRQHLEGQR